MRFLVDLLCARCGGHLRTVVPGSVCPHSPDHVHVDDGHPVVKAWWSSHYEPKMEVVQRTR